MDRILIHFCRCQGKSILPKYYLRRFLLGSHQNCCVLFRNVMKFSSLCENSTATSRIRNIGIVAHIDAGKTTTTERMLYYSGATSTMGEVHDGDTVMDWMTQERERGITITSASAAINWRTHRINLIDTPGHVDFTFEVERSLSVLDGAVVVADAAVGVQAQTIKVWQQANRYHLPRLIYLNKMDKSNASVERSLRSIERRLASLPLLLHIPLIDEQTSQFNGLIDIISGLCYVWPTDQLLSEEGKRYFVQNLFQPKGSNNVDEFLDLATHAKYFDKLQVARENLIGQLCDLNSSLAERVLQVDNLTEIEPTDLHKAIRDVCLSQSATPVLLGSSYRNIGVQPLLDSILRYLPSPDENPRALAIRKSYENQSEFAALAFKIITDRRLGPLTYLRIYSGSLPTATGSGISTYNLNLDTAEKITRIYRPFADHFADLSRSSGPTLASDTNSVTVGDIVVVSGLTSTITGDTLVDAKSATNLEEPVFAGIEVPDPVYYCSLESPSLSKLKPLEAALAQLQREDPSFKVVFDDGKQEQSSATTSIINQIVIKGMGELHIDIIKDRIRRDFGIEANTGPLQISYQESITSSAKHTVELTRSIGGVSNHVHICLETRPAAATVIGDVTHAKKTFSKLKELRIKVINTKENNLSGLLKPWHLKWIHAGVFKALEYGPLFGFPVVCVEVALHEFTTTSRTTQAFVTNAASQCTLEALRSASPILHEPIMRLEIETPEQYIGFILSDLSSRRCEFAGNGTENGEQRQSLTSGDDQNRRLIVYVPLAELGNYSTILRRISSGMATFDIALHSYRAMDQQQTEKAIQNISGVHY